MQVSIDTVNPLLSPPGGLIFSRTFFGGGGGGGLIESGDLKESGGLSNLVKCINGIKVSRGRTWVTAAFSNNKKMVTVLHSIRA